MKWKTSLATVPLLIGLAFGASQAVAAPCSTIDITGSGGDPLFAGSPGDVSTDDVTFRGNDSDACSALYDGNDSEVEIEAIFGGDFTTGPKSNNGLPSGTVEGFSVDYNGDGTWSLTYTGDPLTTDLVVVLKQSQGWAAFIFNDESFPDGTGGTWLVEWCSGQEPFEGSCSGTSLEDLSHLQIYFGDGGGGGQENPEPATLLLLGLGLAGLALTRRRRLRI